MLTLFVKVEDLYLQTMYEYYGEKLKRVVEKLNNCSEKLDAVGMKYWNEVCRGLVTKREAVFKKRLYLRGY